MSNVIVLKESSGASSTRRAPLPSGAFWAGFGDEILVCASNHASAEAAGAEFAAESVWEVGEETIDPEELFLVLQKGRLFQREHPNARVILDKGRFLVVHLPRDQREMVQVSEAPCYSIRSLPRNETVFEIRPRIAAKAPVAAVQAVVDRIDIDRFRADVVALADMHTRHSFSSHYLDAAEMARARLADLGFSVGLQDVTVSSKRTLNVVAERNGALASGRGLVLVGAHLDSINHNGDASSRAPGADDNASGSAGALEIAQVLCDYRGSHDLRVVLFGGEEQGLHGSRQLVAGLSETDRGRLFTMVNMDMISRRNAQSSAVLIEGAPLSQAVIDNAVEAANTYTELEVETSLHPHDSDHVSFIDAGIPAVLTIEGSDGANGDVHTERDTVETLDFTLMHQILRMNVAACANALKLE